MRIQTNATVSATTPHRLPSPSLPNPTPASPTTTGRACLIAVIVRSVLQDGELDDASAENPTQASKSIFVNASAVYATPTRGPLFPPSPHPRKALPEPCLCDGLSPLGYSPTQSTQLLKPSQKTPCYVTP
jgi:hypothetical protein